MWHRWTHLQNCLIDTENKLMATKGERDKLGVWDEQKYTTVYKTEKQPGLTYSRGNYI